MTRRALVEAHLPLVRAVAGRMKRDVLTGADFDDLVAWGSMGLCEAADRFDADRGVRFAAFAYARIRGAMMDGARSALAWRRVRPADLPPPWEPLEDVIDRRRVARALTRALALLPLRERALVEAVDVHGRTVEDAGRLVGCSKSWASIRRRAALAALREQLS